MSALVIAFEECAQDAAELAGQLDLACQMVETRCFPDGESLVRVPESADTVLLYRSLDDPNAKLVEILLAASALRDGGARQVMLVAPYLAYMRQDVAFHPGEAVSQRVIGGLIARHFDGLVTIDPHLHRIAALGEAVPGIPALALSAAPVLSSAIDVAGRPVLIGPDSESRPWVEAIASPLGLEALVGEKVRRGDRDVEIGIAGIEKVDGRPAILVDDVISSGMTMIAATRLALEAGASRVEALATHCLAGEHDLFRMKEAGIERIRTTRTVAGRTACLSVAGLLGDAIRMEGWVGRRV